MKEEFTQTRNKDGVIIRGRHKVVLQGDNFVITLNQPYRENWADPQVYVDEAPKCRFDLTEDDIEMWTKGFRIFTQMRARVGKPMNNDFNFGVK